MHRWSVLFIPRARGPADAEVASPQASGPGGLHPPIGRRAILISFSGNGLSMRSTANVREEMDKIGQEFYLPALDPDGALGGQGRWAVNGR